jgi:hypothetical protein
MLAAFCIMMERLLFGFPFFPTLALSLEALFAALGLARRRA